MKANRWRIAKEGKRDMKKETVNYLRILTDAAMDYCTNGLLSDSPKESLIEVKHLLVLIRKNLGTAPVSKKAE